MSSRLGFCVTVSPTVDAIAAVSAVVGRRDLAGPYPFVVHVRGPAGILDCLLEDVAIDGFNEAFRAAILDATGAYPKRHYLNDDQARAGAAEFSEALERIDPDDGSGHEWGEAP